MRQFACLIITSTVLSCYAHAQDIDTTLKASILIPVNERGYAEYSEVVTTDSVTKDDLFVSALEWMNKTYNSGKSVIQTTDKEGGMIIGKAITKGLTFKNVINVEAGHFSYTIAIYCKDGRYKYVLDNITYVKGEMGVSSGGDLAEEYPHNWSNPNNKQMNREWNKFQVQTNAEIRFLIDDLKKHMDASMKKDEW